MTDSSATVGERLPIRVVVAALSSLLLSIMAPTLNVHLLQWLGLVPMLWVVRENTPRDNRWLGMLYGTVGVAAIFGWLVDTIDLFSNLPMAAALAILVLFSAVFGLPYALMWWIVHPLRRRVGVWWILAWPMAFTVMEWLAGQLFIFPYTYGSGQYQVPLVFQSVGLTGVWGLTTLLLAGNAVVGEVIYRRREGNDELPGFAALAWAATLLAVISYGSHRFETVEAGLRDARVVRMAQIQSPWTMQDRMRGSPSQGFKQWLAWVDEIPPGGVDLVVLPEGASPFPLNIREGRANRARQLIEESVERVGADLLIGGGRHLGTRKNAEHYNSVWMFGQGTEPVYYDKMIPLPFGEYLPFSGWLPGLSEMIGGIGDFRAGNEPVMLSGGGLRIGAPICYEGILPNTCRLWASPDLLVNVTNDAWFGDTAASYQHGMLVAIRATELGVPIVRSTFSGTSFVVEPHGHLYAQTRLFEAVHRRVELRAATFPTLYARFGDWFIGLCALVLAGLWFGAPRMRRD